MSYVLPAAALRFLADLEANNDTAWFAANKKRYEKELKEPSRALAEAVNDVMGGISPAHASDTPHKAVSRINRDIRFSADKTPYNTHVWMGFHASAAPKGTAAGYYLGFSHKDWGVGAGAWAPEKEQLEALRAHIAAEHQTLRAIVETPAFAAVFGGLQGEALKRVPKPYDTDHPAGEWLKLKGVYVRAQGDVALLTSADLLPEVERRFALLRPLVEFLSEGLGRA